MDRSRPVMADRNAVIMYSVLVMHSNSPMDQRLDPFFHKLGERPIDDPPPERDRENFQPPATHVGTHTDEEIERRRVSTTKIQINAAIKRRFFHPSIIAVRINELSCNHFSLTLSDFLAFPSSSTLPFFHAIQIDLYERGDAERNKLEFTETLHIIKAGKLVARDNGEACFPLLTTRTDRKL